MFFVRGIYMLKLKTLSEEEEGPSENYVKRSVLSAEFKTVEDAYKENFWEQKYAWLTCHELRNYD